VLAAPTTPALPPPMDKQRQAWGGLRATWLREQVDHWQPTSRPLPLMIWAPLPVTGKSGQLQAGVRSCQQCLFRRGLFSCRLWCPVLVWSRCSQLRIPARAAVDTVVLPLNVRTVCIRGRTELWSPAPASPDGSPSHHNKAHTHAMFEMSWQIPSLCPRVSVSWSLLQF